jgi:hypothetical protein
VKVELVALIQPEPKTGSKKAENMFQMVYATKSSGLLPRQTVVESGAQARRLGDYSRRELTITYLQSAAERAFLAKY